MITLILGGVLVVPLALAVIFGPLAIAGRQPKAESHYRTGQATGTVVVHEGHSSPLSYRAAVTGG